MLDETIFKSTYMATFLASYMAGRYDNDCARGHELTSGERTWNVQPVEDAQFLADVTWEKIIELRNRGALEC